MSDATADSFAVDDVVQTQDGAGHCLDTTNAGAKDPSRPGVVDSVLSYVDPGYYKNKITEFNVVAQALSDVSDAMRALSTMPDIDPGTAEQATQWLADVQERSNQFGNCAVGINAAVQAVNQAGVGMPGAKLPQMGNLPLVAAKVAGASVLVAWAIDYLHRAQAIAGRYRELASLPDEQYEQAREIDERVDAAVDKANHPIQRVTSVVMWAGLALAAYAGWKLYEHFPIFGRR